MTARVSLTMLAERDCPTLGRCLASAADLVDEVVVVTDPGAAPAWRAGAEAFGAKVVEFDWRDDFAAARDEALRHATGEWAFYLDADEWLDETNRDRLRALFLDLPADAAGYRMDQVSTTALGRTERIRQVRLFRNAPGVRWAYRLHEQVAPALAGLGGALRESGVEYLHDGYRDPRTLDRKRRRNFRVLALDLAERPDDPFVLFNAGVAALDVRRPAEAARLLDRGRRRADFSRVGPPAEELYSALARARALAGDRAAALAACRDGLARLPENPELLFVEGTLLLQAGDAAAAEARLLRCLGLRPAHGQAWQVLTDLLLTSRRHDDAEAVAARLDAVPGLAVDAALCRARVRLARGDGAGAKRTLEEAVAAAPAALLLHELSAHVLLFLKEAAGARAALSRLLALDPGHAWAARTLAGLGPAPTT